MVLTTFSLLNEQDQDPATIPCVKMPMLNETTSTSTMLSWLQTSNEPTSSLISARALILHETKSIPVSLDATMGSDPELQIQVASPTSPVTTIQRGGRRLKSYSSDITQMTTHVPVSAPRSFKTRPKTITKPRPYSTGNVEDFLLRQVSIAGFAQNQSGVWMFKVEIQTNVFDSYVVRRRFTDFKELYHGLLQLQEGAGTTCAPGTDLHRLPALPDHGLVSLVQMFFAPETALQSRALQLEQLIQFINVHPIFSTAAPFLQFLGKNPQCLEVGYVSLSSYEAPRASLDSFRMNATRPRLLQSSPPKPMLCRTNSG